jgi:hypothetical protein
MPPRPTRHHRPGEAHYPVFTWLAQKAEDAARLETRSAAQDAREREAIRCALPGFARKALKAAADTDST